MHVDQLLIQRVPGVLQTGALPLHLVVLIHHIHTAKHELLAVLYLLIVPLDHLREKVMDISSNRVRALNAVHQIRHAPLTGKLLHVAEICILKDGPSLKNKFPVLDQLNDGFQLFNGMVIHMGRRDLEFQVSRLVQGQDQIWIDDPQLLIPLIMQPVYISVNDIVDDIHYKLPPR